MFAGKGSAQVPIAPEDQSLVTALSEGRVDVTPERIVYVAPMPGEDGDGTRESPRRDLIRVIREVEAGTAVHLAPGVYDMSEVRDAFGHESSRLITSNAGEPGRPIVVRTDPERLEGEGMAILDFAYGNRGDWSEAAFVARSAYWVFERFEMRRVYRRGFAAWGGHNTYRDLHLHHANTDGTDNDALIVMGASGGGVDNVVMNNHLHHVGNIEESTDTLLDRGSVNGGCYYSVTRLTYDSETPTAGHEATRAAWEEALLPPDGDVYVVGNHVHDCHYGLGLKNVSRGPYYFLSNRIHDVDYGVFSPFRETQVRNNTIYNAGVGIKLGRAQTNGPLMTYLKMTGNGAHSEVAYNTVIASPVGMEFQGGWGSRVHHNLVVDTDEPVAITRNQFAWWEGGSWPGIRGEFLLGDLGPEHPFWADVPAYAREVPAEYRCMALVDNCYTTEPVIHPVDFRQERSDITDMVFDEDYRVLDADQRAGLFLDETDGAYLRADDGLACGALQTPPMPAGDAGPGSDAGVGMDGGPEIDAGAGDGGTIGDAAMGDATTVDAGAPPSGDGGGCAVVGEADTRFPFGLMLVLWVVVWRRRR